MAAHRSRHAFLSKPLIKKAKHRPKNIHLKRVF
jgi:hypothetical protein